MTEPKLETAKCGCQFYPDLGNIIRHRAKGCVEHEVILFKVFAHTMSALFDKGVCAGCHAPIWWAVTKLGAKAPISERGVVHFSDCPKSGEFRKAKK